MGALPGPSAGTSTSSLGTRLECLRRLLPDMLCWLDETRVQPEAFLPTTDLGLQIKAPFGTQPLAELLDLFARHEATHAEQLVALRRGARLPRP